MFDPAFRQKHTMKHAIQRFLLPALLFMVTVALVRGGPALAEGVADAFDAAEQHYQQGRFTEAAQVLDGLLSRETLPRSTRMRVLELQASSLSALGDQEGAREAVETILEIDPAHLLDPDAVSPGLMKSFYQILDARDQLGYTGEIQTVAILDLGNNSITAHDDMQALGQGLADALITRVSGATSLRVVERERISFIREEIGLNQTDEFDRRTAVRAGRLLGAHTFILGGFTRIDDKLRIDARLVKTETGEILKTHSIEGRLKDVFKLVDTMAQEIVTALGEVGTLPETAAKAGNFEALMEYSKGLHRLDLGELAMAYEHFENSARRAPDFEKASKRMRQLRPLLASMESSRL